MMTLHLNKEKHITIIITTHYMDEADRICDIIAIIDHGKIIAVDTPKNLKEKIGTDIIKIEAQSTDRLLSNLEKSSWLKSFKKQGDSLVLNTTESEKHIAEIVGISNKIGIDINSIDIHKPTLEDVFLHYTGKSIREEEATPKDSMRKMQRMWRR